LRLTHVDRVDCSLSKFARKLQNLCRHLCSYLKFYHKLNGHKLNGHKLNNVHDHKRNNGNSDNGNGHKLNNGHNINDVIQLHRDNYNKRDGDSYKQHNRHIKHGNDNHSDVHDKH
jgi:hypothetical protein